MFFKYLTCFFIQVYVKRKNQFHKQIKAEINKAHLSL